MARLLNGFVKSRHFPTGTVIQTVNNTYNSDGSDGIVGSTFTRFIKSGAYNWKAQIDNVGASNHVLIMSTFVGSNYRDTAGGDFEVGGGWGFFREIADGTITAICEPSTQGFNMHTQNASSANYLGYRSWLKQITLTWLDESPGTGTNIYYLGGKATAAGSQNVSVSSASSHDPFRMTLQEIKR